MKRFASNLSHSWWWDSHISHKNSKWLEENLESMDGSVKTMLKLIEEDADSFAKKAEMYYKKRPELISLVEEFYRRYRSLAERYDHLTGEIRKNMPASLRRELDGNDDESASEHGHEHDHKTRRKHRAAGFDFFLGSRKKEKHEDSSTSSSNSESDDEEHAMYVDLQQKTQEMEDTMNRLKEENELLGKELENKTSQMASLQEQTAVWQSRNSELESQIKSGLIHTEEIHDLRRQLHNLEGENHALKLRLRKSLEEYETSLSKITDLEAMAGSRNEGNLTLEEENFSLKQKQLEMLKQIDKLAGLNEECNHKFLEAGSKINLLLEENRVLKSEREEDLQRLSEDESTVSQLQEEASRLSKEKEDIRTQDLQQLGPLQTLIVQLQEELRLKDVKLDTLLKSNEDLTSQVQNIRSEYDTLKSNYDVCSGRLNELTQELECCDRQNEILRAQNAALEKTHETVDSEKENLRVQLQDSIIECEELNGRLSIIRRELNDRVNVLERLNSSLELERDGLYNEKMKLEEEVTRLNSLLFDVQGQVNFWRDKAELIGSDFDLLHEDKISLANDLSAMSLNHQELQSRVHQLEQNVAEMEKNVSMLQKEKQEMQNLAETLKQSQQALNEENLGLKTHLQTLTEDFVSKKERLKELQVEKFTLKLKSQRLLDGFTKIEQRVHLLQTEFDGLENENSHLKQDWQQTAKKLKEDISTLENDKSSLLGEVSLKVDEIDKLHEEISLLMSHKNELKIQLQLKSDHSAKLQSQIHDLQSLADKYLSQNEAVNNALTQMEAAKKMQEEEMRDLQRHLEDLHVENAQLIEASSNDADTISDLGSKVRLLNAQLNDLGHENLMQKNIISNRDEEKREAIRQLCIAIDHFRHNYKHLQHVLFLLHPSLRKANKN